MPMGQVATTETERRALRVLFAGPIDYAVSGSKATNWNPDWKFNIATLRALKDLGLADYDILESCERSWYLTQEGYDLCGKLQPSP